MEVESLKQLQLGGVRGPYRRILIYGVTGSGKTTTACRLSDLTGIAWTEVDTLMWNPGWDFVSLDVQRERIEAICGRSEWILDAGYAKWMDLVLPRVDLIVCLDYSRSRTFWQLLKRTLARAIDKQEVCNGNVESFRMIFSRKSILVWHCQSFARKRVRMRQWHQANNEFDVILFRNPGELNHWIMDQVVEHVLERQEDFT